MLKYVKVCTDKYSFPRRGVLGDKKDDLCVHCPFCNAATVIPVDDAEPIIAGCGHLDKDDCITPDHDGFSVWFRAGDDETDNDD